MRFSPFLVPRLNYSYSLSDLIFSLLNIRNDLSSDEFEKIFYGKSIFFVNHARGGLRILLNSLNLKKNVRIGVQAFNCHTVFQAIKKSGYILEFIDINDDFSIDVNDLREKIDKIDALIITHTFGIPAQIDDIKNVAHKIPIIEDCAHSFLSRYKGELTGTLGDASIFSFGHAKFPSIGSGGFILLNNLDYLNNTQNEYNRLPDNKISTEIKNIFLNYFFSLVHKKIIYGMLSYPFGKSYDKKFDVMQKKNFDETKILKSNKNLFFKKMRRYQKYFIKQRKNAHDIKVNLKKYQFIDDDSERVMNFFMIPLLCKKRDMLVKISLTHGIEFGKHFSNSITWAKEYGYIQGSCPNTEKVIEKILTIPCYYGLKNNEIKKIKNFLLMTKELI